MKSFFLKFILLLGVVSLFADVTYEGARSLIGPYLALLGASGAAVGTIAGLGEFLGYGVRPLSGWLSDKLGSYWLVTFIGYGINLIAVPLLAFARSWEMAAVFVLLERVGKAIRTPARDTILSYATTEMGRGLGFGVHETLDRVGALAGPLLMSAVLLWGFGFKAGFLILAIPATVALAVLAIARRKVPHPEKLEVEKKKEKLPRQYWHYVIGAGLVAAGFADYPLIAFHFQKSSLLEPGWTALFYAFAMGIDGISSLPMGMLFDQYGKRIVVIGVLVCSFFAPCVFYGGFSLALIGTLLWGVGLGLQGSVLRAAIATLTAPSMRGAAYGTFGFVFGLLWFLGSGVIGFLYDRHLASAVTFSLVMQWLGAVVIARSLGSSGR